MYKMVIIDDEPAELNFISWVVKDNNLPIHICGKGSNGREALSLVDIHQPDFIIIDISMPILSGLDAAKIIKEKYPQMQLYILTAFQRFSYAQTAIKISVDDYLCKPISPEALAEVLKNGIKQCLRERLKHCRQNRVLCKSKTEDSNMQKVLEILGLGRVSRFRSDLQSLDNVEWLLVGSMLCPQQSGYEYALLQAFIRKVKQFDLLRQAVIVSGCRILIWGKGHSEQVVSLLGNIIEEWYAASHIQFSAEIVWLNKKSSNTLDELSRVVYQADTSQFWEQAGIRISDIGTMAPSLDLEMFCSQFVNGVFLVGVDTLDTILNKLLDELKVRHSTREGVVQVILDFFSLVTDNINELGITIEMTTLRQQLQKIVVERDNISQLRVVLNSFVKKLVDKIYSTKKTSTLAAVDWAQKFIQDNYRSDITLEVIAGKLYLSPSYFSRIFKKHTGQGFSQYINSIRMEKAKSLLLTGKYSVVEVADRVGIQDPSYFHHIFKKYHNATPGYFIGNPKQAFNR